MTFKSCQHHTYVTNETNYKVAITQVKLT